ncbi:BEL1-like homeodomain protein 1 [Apostasia shenzhenica]|uniref:BEL1-like homeodomain protein 1 n=1 Tax=Apostasia shenzhenica TaxID=1088818 RepID=A0A2H9ZUQ6_9ASPA|nr:BEL1-like homeodomain protein 1 [Apostasia shenzhenica]
MATYFHGAPEIQPDGLQTLYLMNPGYVGYSDPAGAPANMVLLNSNMNSLNPINLSPTPNHQQQQHFFGIPIQPPENSHRTPADLPPFHGLASRIHYNLWNPATASNSAGRGAAVHPHQQGLSLSLSPNQAPYGAEIPTPVPEISPVVAAEGMKLMGPLTAPVGPAGLQSVLMNSKYLKAAQELLDEVVRVGRGAGGEPSKKEEAKSPIKDGRELEFKGGGESCGKREVELTTAEKQELQMRKAKLVSMLEEVEQRYRQYHHQMEIVVSSFEAVAGHGSARTYTALALQTISKQFRCLRDAISGQIKLASRNIGEEDCTVTGAKSIGSRLRLVDHHLRQQRALQQLGMIQHNAWRPQRGLPERAVSILRAWLFEHFLHPYPKDSDKLMLAKQTGLTRSQVFMKNSLIIRKMEKLC